MWYLCNVGSETNGSLVDEGVENALHLQSTNLPVSLYGQKGGDPPLCPREQKGETETRDLSRETETRETVPVIPYYYGSSA